MRVIESWWTITPSIVFLGVYYTLYVGATCRRCGRPVWWQWWRR